METESGNVPKTCLMLVDTPVESDRRVLSCIAAYERAGVAVEIVNVKKAPISAKAWVIAAPSIIWFIVWFTLIWAASVIRCLPRYQYMWRVKNLTHYRLRPVNLPLMFWYETFAHIARGVAFTHANKSQWIKADFIHAHDLAALSFAQFFETRAGTMLTYDAHELSAFRNRPEQSWLSGLLITGFESASIRRSVNHVISVSPFILAYMRFFARKAASFNLIINDFYLAKNIVRNSSEPQSERYAIVYIGSVIKGRGLTELVKLFEKTKECSLYIYCPEDTERQRSFGDVYDQAENVTVRYGPYDKTIAKDLEPFHRVYGWAGLEDICLSYRYAVPNKIFQYVKFGIPPIADKKLYTFNFLRKYVKILSGDIITDEVIKLKSSLGNDEYYSISNNIMSGFFGDDLYYESCINKFVKNLKRD
ncbi:MAG: hypothetical protein ACPGGK_06330 [Pikeienuella sp.]